MTPKPSIFVVEDDADVRDALTLSLELEGYSVRSAANGAEALESLRDAPLPELILLDLMMPVMNGWEFRNRQKENAELAHIPVVIMTADERAKQRANSVGVAGYLIKPFSIEALMETVRHSL